MTPTWYVISNFEYERGSLLDGVRLLEGPPFVGDCDDFVWTVLVAMMGGVDEAIEALDDGRATIWRVKSPSNGIIPRHVALHVRGKGWICSTSRKWKPTPGPNKPKYRITKASLFAGTALGTIVGVFT